VLVGWKTFEIQNEFMIIDPSEKDLDGHLRDYKTDKIVRHKQISYWLNFMTRRKQLYYIFVYQNGYFDIRILYLVLKHGLFTFLWKQLCL